MRGKHFYINKTKIFARGVLIISIAISILAFVFLFISNAFANVDNSDVYQLNEKSDSINEVDNDPLKITFQQNPLGSIYVIDTVSHRDVTDGYTCPVGTKSITTYG